MSALRKTLIHYDECVRPTVLGNALGNSVVDGVNSSNQARKQALADSNASMDDVNALMDKISTEMNEPLSKNPKTDFTPSAIDNEKPISILKGSRYSDLQGSDIDLALLESAKERAYLEKIASAPSLEDVSIPKTVADAPSFIKIPEKLNSSFGKLWDASFPSGRSKEQGGTIVLDADSEVSMVNIGGHGSTSGNFDPNLSVLKGSKLLGTFHTHPYDDWEGSYTGVSFSGGDVGYMLNKNLNVMIVQSGEEQFLLLRTAEALKSFSIEDYQHLSASSYKRQSELYVQNGDFVKSANQVAAENAARYNLAYYRGKNGVFELVSK